MPFAGRDLRAESRYRISIPLRFTREGQNVERKARTADFSEQGMFLQSDTLEPVGTRVEVRVSLDGSEPITLRGIVVWFNDRGAKGAGMGIQLFGTPQAYLRHLVDLVAALRMSGRLHEA